MAEAGKAGKWWNIGSDFWLQQHVDPQEHWQIQTVNRQGKTLKLKR